MERVSDSEGINLEEGVSKTATDPETPEETPEDDTDDATDTPDDGDGDDSE